MKSKITRAKIFHIVKIVLLVIVISIIFLSLLGTVAHAAGLVDDIISPQNEFSKYAQENYQLDFYVDNSWAWLPWNWLDGIGKSVQYGLYAITNFVWTISLYISNATGYVVQQAFKLDFINDMADSIGKNIQTIAGVTSHGITNNGFYGGLLLFMIIIIGIYMTYVGLIKRETSKATHAVINFVVVFLLSAGFIAYAPDYIKKINDFSKDLSTMSLSVGTKILIPDSDSKGEDSVDLIRDSLFAIQVKQPWMLLQFGDSDIEKLGKDRVGKVLSASPSEDNGKARENAVKAEIEDRHNNYLSIPKVIERLGMVFFLLIFNLGISIFVFLLTGIMLFSQMLFIISAMFLPISFILSMIPGFENMAKSAIVKVFNTIMMRAGITLVVSITFSLSSMFYNISDKYPFFMVAFLQIVLFFGVYATLGELMSMVNLTPDSSKNIGRRVLGRPYRRIQRQARQMTRVVTSAGAGALVGSAITRENMKNERENPSENMKNENHSARVKKMGSKAGAVMDAKNRIRDKAAAVKESVKDMPTQGAYTIHSAKEKMKNSASDFRQEVGAVREERQQKRDEKMNRKKETIAKKRAEMGLVKHAQRTEKNPASRNDDVDVKETSKKGFQESADKQAERPVVASIHKKTSLNDKPLKEKTDRPVINEAKKKSARGIQEDVKQGTISSETQTSKRYKTTESMRNKKRTRFERRAEKEAAEFNTENEQKAAIKNSDTRRKKG